MILNYRFVLAAWACTALCSAQTILLDSFNIGASAGSVRTGTSWVGNVSQQSGSISTVGTSKDDNG